MNGMLQPTEQHRALERLAGKWIGPEMLHASPWAPAATVTGRVNARMDIDGFFLIQDYVQERDGRVSYRGHGIFGWDSKQESYTWYWVDSMGFVPPAPSRGQWQGDTLTLDHPPIGERRAHYTYQ